MHQPGCARFSKGDGANVFGQRSMFFIKLALVAAVEAMVLGLVVGVALGEWADLTHSAAGMLLP